MSEIAAKAQTLAAPAPVTPVSATGLGATVLAVLAFSSSSSILRLADTSATTVVFWRMTIAVVVWHGWMAAKGIRITPAQWKRAVLPGVCFGLNIMLFSMAVTRTSIAHAEFISNLAPLLVVPVGARFFGESVAPRALSWAVTALAGMALVLFNGPAGNSASLGGDALAALAVGTWASYMLLTRAKLGDMDVARFMGAISPIALVVIAPVAIGRGDVLDVSARGWASIAVLGVLSSVLSHGLIVFAQQHVPVAMISILQVAQPALAVGWAFLLVDEQVNAWQLVGGAVVVVSLALFVLTARRMAAAAPPAP